MKEYVEKIIEIILEDVSCEHQKIEEFPHGPKIDDPTYFLDDQNMVIEKCIKAIPARLIERPEITDRFILEKAEELFKKLFHAPGMIYKGPYVQHMNTIKDFLCSILNELSAKINLIGKEESCSQK